MNDKQANSNTYWWLTILLLSVATAFIYFLIFEPQLASVWLRDNLVLSWAILGVLICLVGLFFLRRALSDDQRRSVDRIRGGVYCAIGGTILLALIFTN